MKPRVITWQNLVNYINSYLMRQTKETFPFRWPGQARMFNKIILKIRWVHPHSFIMNSLLLLLVNPFCTRGRFEIIHFSPETFVIVSRDGQRTGPADKGRTMYARIVRVFFFLSRLGLTHVSCLRKKYDNFFFIFFKY